MYARPSTWLVLGIAALALAFELLVLPLSEDLMQARNSAAKAKADFHWMRANVGVAATPALAAGTGGNPLQLIEDALVRAGIRAAAERIERQTNSVVVAVRDAPFAATVRALALIEQELRLPIGSFRFTPGAGAGTVDGVIVVVTDT